ncbi:hypothetical protein KL942_000437 [Ogataea angusta]|uniref:U3 small nucleolar RNA-associated protein 11 n=1 Tax=Pichia angusta TaxID=870730 RepID=A0ABQ7S3E4_PICAN|nr:hypothetical protein KL942_000437 [Ogataea angusta]KAG7852506.1 hypothetical protein KL940_000207 [Ogataea angusta]
MVKLVHNVQKKQHRERAQPQDRARFGFLEKKKDYRLRAADYHKKQAQLKILKQKAKLRNDDEYYHSMTRRKTDKDGVLIAERGNEVLSNDEVLLLKTQDANYLTMTRQSEARKIEKEMKNLDSFKGAGSHTVFVDSEEQLEQFDPVQYFDTDASLLGKRENRLRKRISEAQARAQEAQEAAAAGAAHGARGEAEKAAGDGGAAETVDEEGREEEGADEGRQDGVQMEERAQEIGHPCTTNTGNHTSHMRFAEKYI